MSPKSQKKPHHHGNLREALISAGIEILTESGRDGLTLRACAARAGVSHAAPAHHFDGLPGLLTAIAARGFELFTQSMIEERDRAERTPRDALVAICRGYLKFSERHPALFTLIFNTPGTLLDSQDLQENGSAAYQVLEQACAPFEPLSDHPRSTEIMVWSLVHGLASLRLARRFGPESTSETHPTIEDLLPPLQLRPTPPTS